MMIKPPCNTRRRAVFEINDRVLVTNKIGFVKERTGAMNQPVIAVLCIRTDALAMKAREKRSRTRSVKAPVVIKNADLQTGNFLSMDE
jgi:rRNA processing protein Gar1